MHDKFKKHLVSNMDDMKLDLRRYVDEKQKVVLRVLRQETEDKILYEMKERLQVPGLVGNNCPYSTIGNFLMQFHHKTSKRMQKKWGGAYKLREWRESNTRKKREGK